MTRMNLTAIAGRGLDRWKRLDRDLKLFVLANVFIGFGMCVDSSTFNNYWKDIYHLGVSERTLLELPRELPGFLSAFFIGLLYSLGDIRIAAFANLFAAVGMFVLGIIPPIYGVMLMGVFVYSSGQHMFMPLSNTIGMNFAKDGRVGRTLGKISAANTAALVSGSLVLMGLFSFFNLTYLAAFSIGAVSFLAASVCMFMMSKTRTAPMKRRWFVKKEYNLFYVMCLLWGARKQIFLTFAPWVIVDVFRQPVTTMTLLFFIVSTIGIGLKPLIGHWIDRIGERAVLAGEAILIIVVCMFYAFAADILPPGIALVVVCACYVIDQGSSAVHMARSTYMRRIALSPDDVSPTLSLGVSIDHIMSISIPLIGGFVWATSGSEGYRLVFMGGAVIALLNWVAAMRIAPAIKSTPEPAAAA